MPTAIFGGALGLMGADLQQRQQEGAVNAAVEAAAWRPQNLWTPMGQVSFGGGNPSFTMSQEMADMIGGFQGLGMQGLSGQTPWSPAIGQAGMYGSGFLAPAFQGAYGMFGQNAPQFFNDPSFLQQAAPGMVNSAQANLQNSLAGQQQLNQQAGMMTNYGLQQGALGQQFLGFQGPGNYSQQAADRTAALRAMALPQQERQVNAALEGLHLGGNLGRNSTNTGEAMGRIAAMQDAQDQGFIMQGQDLAMGLRNQDLAQQQAAWGVGSALAGQGAQSLLSGGNLYGAGLGYAQQGYGGLMNAYGAVPGMENAMFNQGMNWQTQAQQNALSRLGLTSDMLGLSANLMGQNVGLGTAGLDASRAVFGDAMDAMQMSNAFSTSQAAAGANQAAALLQNIPSHVGSWFSGMGEGLMSAGGGFAGIGNSIAGMFGGKSG